MASASSPRTTVRQSPTDVNRFFFDFDASGSDGQGTLIGDMLEDTAAALGGTITQWEPIKDSGSWHLRVHLHYA